MWSTCKMRLTLFVFCYILTIIFGQNSSASLQSNTTQTNLRQKIGMQRISNCVAKFDDGSVLDLSTLDDPNNQLYTMAF